METMTEQTTLDGQQIPAWARTVGPGWAPLLDRLHHQLAALAADYRIEGFRSNLGGVRLHISDRFDAEGEFDGAYADAATAFIDAAEVASEKTCEICGAPGRPRFRGDRRGTWVQTLCRACPASRTPPHTGPFEAHR
jgi:hypothetical protein